MTKEEKKKKKKKQAELAFLGFFKQKDLFWL